MKSTNAIPSVAATGHEIGRISEQHWDRFLRKMLHGPATEVTGQLASLMTGAAHPFANFALIRDSRDETSAKTVMQRLAAHNVPAAVMFVGRVDSPMTNLLGGQGFAPHKSMNAMAVDIDRLPAVQLADGCSFVRIGPGPMCRAWADGFVKGFEFPPIMGEMFSPEVVGPDTAKDAPVQFFCILKDGQPVSTSMLFLDDGVAGIYCIATVPSERGKGLGAYATAATLRHAQTLGYSVGVLQATEAGYPVYVRLGFQDVGEIPLFVRMPGG